MEVADKILEKDFETFLCRDCFGSDFGSDFGVRLDTNFIQRSSKSAIIFVLISALLYIYATHLKRTLIIGNLVISILVALSVLIVGVFELLPAFKGNILTGGNNNQNSRLVFLWLYYCSFDQVEFQYFLKLCF